ncbi:MAG: hypothetical protein NWE94_10275 [Candidatus Bathyarchaeota archaeon]|nr:hypothetical protein [Candidatus Bathyarchaeota archaeon]
MKPKKSYKRGYPVAILIGVEANQAALWRIYSNVAKHEKTIPLNDAENSPKAQYNFYEATINALRPILKEGVKSIIIASPAKSNHAKNFLNHIQTHHTWLTQGPNKTVISEITGSARTQPEVAALAKNPLFRQTINETTAQESENIIETLEKRLSTSSQDTLVLYEFTEIETAILTPWKPSKPKPEILLLTDVYLANARAKNRLNRLMQIAANRNIQTRILNAESPAGKRLAQLGGITLLTKAT